MIKAAVFGLACGIVGVILTLGLFHLYDDHAALHAIIKLINDNAAKQNGAASRTP